MLHVLTFFAASDGIVNENLVERFIQEARFFLRVLDLAGERTQQDIPATGYVHLEWILSKTANFSVPRSSRPLLMMEPSY